MLDCYWAKLMPMRRVALHLLCIFPAIYVHIRNILQMLIH